MARDRHASDKKERKRKHKHKHKKADSRKSSRRDDRERSVSRSPTRKHKSRKSHKSRDDHASLPGGSARISEDDYFLRATEFRVWLAQAKGKYVDDLATEEATALFRDDFARKWNRGKLARMFYEGIPDAVLEQTKRTRHQWGFVSKLGDRERFTLASTKDSVGVATRKEDLLVSSSGSGSGGNGNSHVRALGAAKEPESERQGGDSSRKRKSEVEEEDERDERRRRRKSERKRQRESRDVALEELAPKATGREALLEKRRQVGQRLHGAARDREEGRDGLDQSDDFLMGGRGADDEYRRRVAQRDSMRHRKDQERQDKVAALAAKESARMDKFLEDMGLSGAGANGGKPVTIAPRREEST